jgi:double-stranded uracil-DNA glycosylase
MLPDYLGPGLDVVFCGTAAGRASAERGHYYAGPGNRFWPLLAQTGLTPHQFRPEEDHKLLSLGIGLTDLAKGVSGMDRDIPASAYAPAALRQVIATYAPRRLAFTSLKAARVALGARHSPGRADSAVFSGVQIWVLPSPSGAARRYFSPTPWQQLADDIKADRERAPKA